MPAVPLEFDLCKPFMVDKKLPSLCYAAVLRCGRNARLGDVVLTYCVHWMLWLSLSSCCN